MKPHEAETILSALESIYRSPVAQERDLWLLTLQSADAEAASTIVIKQWAHGRNLPRYRPNLPELMQAIKTQTRLAERDAPEPVAIAEPHLSALIPFNPTVPPAWVEAWKLARARGDLRVFPQQEHAYRADGREWPPPAGLMPPERQAALEAEAAGKLS